MELRQLRYLVRVLELGSVTKAAESLRISQPAVGEQIRNLEEELGTGLLVRHSRGIEPTEAGRLLFSKARAILMQVDDARAAVRGLSAGLRGSVTIGLTPGLTEASAAPVIEACAREYPGIVLNVIEDLSSSLVRRVGTGGDQLCLAVVSGFEVATTPGLAATRLFEEDLYAVAHPTMLGRSNEPIGFTEFAQCRLVLLGNGAAFQEHGLKAQLLRLAEAAAVSLSIVSEISAISVVKQLAEREVGVAVLPWDAVRQLTEAGRLCARRIVSPRVCRTLHLVWSTWRELTASEAAVRTVLGRVVLEGRVPLIETSQADESS